MAGAEPFYFPGSGDSGAIGVLCLHGLTATPDEVRWLGQYLNEEKGFTVYGPRITGHGSHYRDLGHLQWQDWYLLALDGFHVLRQQCRQVYVAGLSMGALLTLLLGAAEQVDGLVVMAAPVTLPDARLLPYARWLKLVRPYIHLPDRTDFPERLRLQQAERGESTYGRLRYNVWATRALQELNELMRVVNLHLPGVQEPTLLMYSTKDETVPLINQEHVRSRLGSTVIETHTFERSGHILTQDYDHQEVFERAGDFIERVAAQRHQP